jgi:hypothetical protein
MITFINENLFKLDTQEVSNDNGTHYKIDVLTANAVKKGKSEEVKNHIITRIISPIEDYNSYNVNIATSPGHNGMQNVSIRASERNTYDSDIILIAIPFNGIAEPIPESKEYRIHKGYVVRSDKRDIECNGVLYKKVLYLLVEPNIGLFNEDHKYHTDEIKLNFVSYNLETNEDNTTVTMKSTVEISFTAEAVKYTDSVEESDPVDPDAYKGQMLFHTYSKKNKPAGDKERAPKHEKSGDKKFNKNKDHNNGYKKKNNFHGKKGNR